MKRLICIILAVVLCFGLLTACGSSESGGNGGRDGGKKTLSAFDVIYSREGVKEFFDIVCKNIDAEWARVISVNESYYSVEDFLEATLEIKLTEMAPLKVSVRVYNRGGSEKASRIEVASGARGFHNEYYTTKALILGLEKTLGRGGAEDYLALFDEMLNRDNMDTDKYEYWVCDTARAEIAVSGWILKYNLMRDMKN